MSVTLLATVFDGRGSSQSQNVAEEQTISPVGKGRRESTLNLRLRVLRGEAGYCSRSATRPRPLCLRLFPPKWNHRLSLLLAALPPAARTRQPAGPHPPGCPGRWATDPQRGPSTGGRSDPTTRDHTWPVSLRLSSILPPSGRFSQRPPPGGSWAPGPPTSDTAQAPLPLHPQGSFTLDRTRGAPDSCGQVRPSAPGTCERTL